MSFSLPSGCYYQQTSREGYDAANGDYSQVEIKGSYAALKTALNALRTGDRIGIYGKARAWDLQSSNGAGILSITCSKAQDDGGDDDTAKLKKEVWSIRSVRNDCSILQYCGESNTNPNRAEIECWMREPDGEVAGAFKYKNGDGEEVSLSAPSRVLANKIARGVDSVIRFYAVLTRRRTYDQAPPACLENLGLIDTPTGYGGSTAIKPSGLAAAIQARTWLKVQDDADEQSNGDWVRTESWMGIIAGEESRGWDPNFYSPDSNTRWPIPYSG